MTTAVSTRRSAGILLGLLFLLTASVSFAEAPGRGRPAAAETRLAFTFAGGVAAAGDLFTVEVPATITWDAPSGQAFNARRYTVTLDEDFTLGEGIQRGMSSGANTHLNFGRFEGALARFNQFVDEAIA